MYLKNIEIHGFKSFANRIHLTFHNGITAIVGPNGSGKSNVADAIRWVLGEQSSKQLRGSSMQDVIFSGTELRKPLGYAFVAITLDNSDHSLPIEYEEVTVSRRLYRSGESEYMINGSGCRLRDINELFYDTGIGKEGYSIIGQGQIDQILSSKPEDRRALFDEAAGIVKYKLRKEASIKKLEEEQQNLLRLNDILSELEKQVEPLSKQAETAKVYLKNRDRLKTLDVNLFLLDSSEQRKNLVETGQKLDTAKNDLSETKNRYEKARTDYDEMNAALEILEDEIEEARNNMTRSSVMKEKLEGQIGILQEQIRSARSNDKHFHERQNSLMEEISSIQRELEKQEEEKSRIDKELQAFSAAHQEARDGSEALSGKVLSLTEQIEEKKSALLTLLSERAQIQSRQSSLETETQQAKIRKAELTSRLVQAQSVEQEQSEAILKYREAFEAVTAEIVTLNQKQKDYESEIAGMKEKLTAYDTQLRSAQAGYHSEKSRLDALTNLTERYEGYGGSVKRVMEQKASVPGIIGVVADIIKTEEQYETAIETALGGSIQNVVTQDEETAKRLISFLKREHAGRATFLPLTSIRDHREFRESSVLKEPGVIALASSLVQMEDRYRDVAESLLGRIVVTRDIDSALKLASKYRHSLRIVTIGGEQLSPGGAISGGAFRNSSNLLGRRRELEALKDKVKNFEQSAREAQDAIARTKERRNELRTEMETIRMTLQQKFIEQNTARLNVVKEEERQKEAEGSFSSLKKETEELGNRLQDIATRKEEIAGLLLDSETRETKYQDEIRQAQEALVSLREEEQKAREEVAKSEIEAEKFRQRIGFCKENIDRVLETLRSKKRDLAEVEASLHENEETLAGREENVGKITETIAASKKAQSGAQEIFQKKQQEKEELSARQKTFFATRESLSEQMNLLDKEVTRLAAQKDKLQEAIENRINYMWDEYEITLSDAEQMKDPELTDLAALKKEISTIKDAIKKLGDVNVNAIEDYRALMERFTFMKGQYDDLVSARERLLGIIEELDTSMRERFRDQFDRINHSFHEVFKIMFGGGKGDLELVEEEDILSAGIRINAQPPGKKLQNMMQLSGGEKALTAIALLFAIQKLKPSPFCLLDEIEAALDENNVVRFAEYLHHLKETQFIVITHRRGTMENADRLYGITMQEKGVSILVSVNLIDKELTN